MNVRTRHIGKLFAVFAALCITATAYSQSIRVVESPERLPLPYASLAKISPTGDRISFSGERFNKLFVNDLKASSVNEVSSSASVGWGHQWSPDGRLIAVRANHPDTRTKRVSLELIDVLNKTITPVTDQLNSRSRLSLPEWSSANMLTYSTVAGIAMKRTVVDDSTVAVVNAELLGLSFKRWNDNALELHAEAKVQNVRPFRESRQVLNNSWSPERKLSAVEFSGRPSLYVVSDNGKTPFLLDERGEYPCWFNNQFVVYMVTEDDGYKITAGDIWIADKDGKMKKNLTEGLNDIALYPSAAQDGTIVFTTESGAVYKMKIEIEK